MVEVIIKGKASIGRTRSEQEKNLRKEWGATMSDKNLDKLEHLEKKGKEQTGSKDNFISQADIDEVE